MIVLPRERVKPTSRDSPQPPAVSAFARRGSPRRAVAPDCSAFDSKREPGMLEGVKAVVGRKDDDLSPPRRRLHGTAGRLVNDPGLYVKLDSPAARTNRLLLDFQKNPAPDLEDMTLVKVF